MPNTPPLFINKFWQFNSAHIRTTDQTEVEFLSDALARGLREIQSDMNGDRMHNQQVANADTDPHRAALRKMHDPFIDDPGASP